MFFAEASTLTTPRLPSIASVTLTPGILARGPWRTDQIATRWRQDAFEAGAEASARADAAVAALADRGSPSHDGVAARLAGFELTGDRLTVELQPVRWALRLLDQDAQGSFSVLCTVRDTEGRWLAGRRAPWVATWAGRWALGAGGAVEIGENPVDTLARELEEEWAVTPERLGVEALVCLPNRLVMLVGLAWLAPGAEVTRDAEHDAHAWWPADPAEWPPEAHPSLRALAALLEGTG
jgi:ADP-ribose pyrophosphatase YjhB (NUDIX family)